MRVFQCLIVPWISPRCVILQCSVLKTTKFTHSLHEHDALNAPNVPSVAYQASRALESNASSRRRVRSVLLTKWKEQGFSLETREVHNSLLLPSFPENQREKVCYRNFWTNMRREIEGKTASNLSFGTSSTVQPEVRRWRLSGNGQLNLKVRVGRRKRESTLITTERHRLKARDEMSLIRGSSAQPTAKT